MLIFDENTRPIIFQSHSDPTPSDYFWVFDLEMMDFTLTKIVFLEDTVGPSITLQVGNFNFDIPSFWNLLIYDPDTSQIDVISLKEACGKSFTALVYGPNTNTVTGVKVVAVDYSPCKSHVYPALNKHQMLCHPIGPDSWVMVSPADSFNKYLRDAVIGDIM